MGVWNFKTKPINQCFFEDFFILKIEYWLWIILWKWVNIALAPWGSLLVCGPIYLIILNWCIWFPDFKTQLRLSKLVLFFEFQVITFARTYNTDLVVCRCAYFCLYSPVSICKSNYMSINTRAAHIVSLCRSFRWCFVTSTSVQLSRGENIYKAQCA